jgi:hypothetical protein
MLTDVLSTVDWCFDDVPNEELIACCYWEYARESAFIRELRKRSWEHWRPLYMKDKWWNAPEDKRLHADLQTAQSIGHPAEVFLAGISCPPDGVLPDAPPLKPGLAHPLTGSFPKPWQKLTKTERAYRAHIRSDVECIPLLPFSRGITLDAESIVDWVMARRREIDMENVHVRRANPNKTEESLCREGKIQFPVIQPSLFWEGGREVTVVSIHWGDFTDDEIANYLRKWIKLNRPKDITAPDRKGKKLSDWRVALNRLGIMRALHAYTFADNRFPAAFKERGEKFCYFARKSALVKFHELFPFHPKTEKPINWQTKGRRCK